jgi:hypothetical protein
MWFTFGKIHFRRGREVLTPAPNDQLGFARRYGQTEAWSGCYLLSEEDRRDWKPAVIGPPAPPRVLSIRVTLLLRCRVGTWHTAATPAKAFLRSASGAFLSSKGHRRRACRAAVDPERKSSFLEESRTQTVPGSRVLYHSGPVPNLLKFLRRWGRAGDCGFRSDAGR